MFLQQRTWSPFCRLVMYKIKTLPFEDQRAAATTATAAVCRNLPLNVSHRETSTFWVSFWDVCSRVAKVAKLEPHPKRLAHVAWYVEALTFNSIYCHLPADYLSTLSMSSTSLGSDCEQTGPDSVLWGSAVDFRRGDTKGMLSKVQPRLIPSVCDQIKCASKFSR